MGLRDLALSKQKAELLTSRLQENNLFLKDVLVSHHRKRNTDLSTVFKIDGPLYYCDNQGWRIKVGSRSRGSRCFSWESESKNYACQSRSRKNMLAKV